jgi:hypothetical protein
MDTQRDWSSGNSYRESVSAENPQLTGAYGRAWPDSVVPPWSVPPGLIPEDLVDEDLVDEDLVDEDLVDEDPVDEDPVDEDRADDQPDDEADDEDGWPGVAAPAAWFLPTAENRASPRATGIGPDGSGRDASGPDNAELGADGATSETDVPGEDRRVRDTRVIPRPRQEQAEPAVGPTWALSGRAGGPGFEARPPDPRARKLTAELSPWQKAQGVWNESGMAWEPDTRPGSMPFLLSAPVFAEPEAEPVADPEAEAAPEAALEPVLEPDGEDGGLDDHLEARWDRPFDPAPSAASRREATATLLLERELGRGGWRPDTRRNHVSRRTAAIAMPVIVLVAVAALALALLTGHGPRFGQLADDQHANQPGTGHAVLPQSLAAAAFGTYPGQQQRGVFQAVNRIVASGNTIVTIGSQQSDGVVRQQFFVSTNGGTTWRLAPVQAAGGGPAPVGYPAARLAGGPGGWLAIGPQAIWTSKDGTSWTLAATHGITPQLPGDSVWVLTSTAQGYLAAGTGAAGHGATQAVIWTSANGLTWQRKTAAQLGLAGPGETVRNISYATWRGADAIISGEVAARGTTYSGVWLSTDGGSAWTRVTIPADHGAGTSVTGLGFDDSGMIAVRPGRSASGADIGVAYFSPNGRAWQYSATIDAAGGWSPSLVKGSDYGFVVAGTDAAGQIVAYTSTGTGTSWQPTGALGDAADASVVGATVAPTGAIVAVGYTAGSKASQQPVFLEANTAGSVRPISLAGIPGATVPELTVDGLAVADGQQVAVGSADGYPAIWRKGSGDAWALVTQLSSVSAVPGLSALTSVTHGRAGWLAVGVPGPVVLTSADGTTWQPAAGPGSIADDLAGVRAVATAAGPAGYIIVGRLVTPGGSCVADVWWSPNLTTWTRAHDVNDATGSSQVLAVAADAYGFVSAGAHDGHPAVWTTTNGRSWKTIVLPMPAGASGAVLRQIAISGDRVAALGQATTAAGPEPIAELSVDGGASWVQVPFRAPGPDTAFTALTAGAGGFTAAAQFGEPGQQEVAVWTSATGTIWTPSQISGLTGAQPGGRYLLGALAPAGTGVTGIGSAATQQSQQLFSLALPARRS